MCDAAEQDAQALTRDFAVISADQLNLPNTEQFAFRYDVIEFCTAIKPFCFRWLFEHTDADRIVYLDPDILVLSPLSKVAELFDRGACAILTPHLTARVDDGFRPNELNMLRVGAYNLGFIALARGSASAALVDWWCDRLERGAVVDVQNGLFTDQKWADLMPCLFEGVAVLRDPGYNVAYWNLMHRRVARRDGKWYANEAEIAFIHFSGIDPANPAIFSKHQNRYTLDSLKQVGELKPLYLKYLELLVANGHAESNKLPYRFDFLAEGTRIHPVMRSYFRRHLDGGAAAADKPFSYLNRDFFNQAEPSIESNGLISRFMYGLYLHQRELQGVFNLKDIPGRRRYAEWFVDIASVVYSVDQAFITPVRARLYAATEQPSARASWRGRLKTWLSVRAQQAYRWNPRLALRVAERLPASLVTGLRTNFMLYGTGAGEQPHGRGGALLRAHQNPGTTLVGYANGEFGIAENMRYAASALRAAGYPFDVFGVAPGSGYSEAESHLGRIAVEQSTNPIQLYCVNADQMRHVLASLGAERTADAYRIGYWFWELAKFPREWYGAFDTIDEIWAPSRFIQDALSRVADKPVVHMPVAVDFRIGGRYSRRSRTSCSFLATTSIRSASARMCKP